MNLTQEQIGILTKPENLGAVRIADFVPASDRQDLLAEFEGLPWLDAYKRYRNKRGAEIIQRYRTFALDLLHGPDELLQEMPHTRNLIFRTEEVVRGLGIATLAGWTVNEIGINYYDNPELGITYHRDNHPFRGAVAVASVEGECDFKVRSGDREESFRNVAGDLTLMRAPGLIDVPVLEDFEERPEHAVGKIYRIPRISVVMRNSVAEDVLPDFQYNNLPYTFKNRTLKSL